MTVDSAEVNAVRRRCGSKKLNLHTKPTDYDKPPSAKNVCNCGASPRTSERVQPCFVDDGVESANEANKIETLDALVAGRSGNPKNNCARTIAKDVSWVADEGTSRPAFGSAARLPAPDRVERASRPASAQTRVPSLRPRTEKVHEAKQIQALDALVASRSGKTDLLEFVVSLLQDVVSRNGDHAFPKEVISETMRVLTHLENKEGSTGASQASSHLGIAMSDDLDGKPTQQVLQVLRRLAIQSGMNIREILGQVLWHHRHEEVLKTDRSRSIAKDVSWVTDFVDSGSDVMYHVEEVFTDLTAASGGRMDFRQWQKVVDLAQRNPILRGRVKRYEVDVMFYSRTKATTEGFTISLRTLKQLLVTLADVMRVHPFMVFLAVGCNDAKQAGTAAA